MFYCIVFDFLNYYIKKYGNKIELIKKKITFYLCFNLCPKNPFKSVIIILQIFNTSQYLNL